MLACSDFPTVFFWAEYREYPIVKKKRTKPTKEFGEV
jgi:hypothetical protein